MSDASRELAAMIGEGGEAGPFAPKKERIPVTGKDSKEVVDWCMEVLESGVEVPEVPEPVLAEIGRRETERRLASGENFDGEDQDTRSWRSELARRGRELLASRREGEEELNRGKEFGGKDGKTRSCLERLWRSRARTLTDCANSLSKRRGSPDTPWYAMASTYQLCADELADAPEDLFAEMGIEGKEGE